MKNVPLKTYLRTFRRRSGLSSDELAYLLGTSSGTSVLRHEKAGRLPNLRTALGYELVLGATARELYAGLARSLEPGIRSRAVKLTARLLRGRETAARRQKLETIARLTDASE